MVSKPVALQRRPDIFGIVRRIGLACRLACFRRHHDGASVGTTIVGERSLAGAITWHSSIEQEWP